MASLITFQRGYEGVEGENVEVDLAQLHLGNILNEADDNTGVEKKELQKALQEDTYTVDQAVDALGFGRFQIKLSIFTGLAWMADSMEMMILSILSPALHCAWGLEGWQKALITTIVFCGMMASSSFWGSVCDKYGRKKELVLASVITFYFGFLSAFSPSYVWMLVLRGCVGIGIGGVPQSVTLYSEFLPSKTRAKAIVLIELSWAVGACFEVLLALVVMPGLGWRWLLGISAVPLLVFCLACWWVPESARFDIARGRPDLARNTLEMIARENGRVLPPGRLVMEQTLDATPSAEKKSQRGQIINLFSSELLKTTSLLWFIWFANAFSYYGVVLMTTELFEKGDECHGGVEGPRISRPTCALDCVSLTTKDYVDLLWTTLSEFPGLFITALIIDLVGRKWTMAAEFVIFSLFTYLVMICHSRTVLTIFLFVARAFISGCFQAAYVYTPEVYPTTLRAIGLGAASMTARIGCIITPFVAQVLLNHSVYAACSLYATVCLIATGTSLLLPIETKGRSMKETQTSN